MLISTGISMLLKSSRFPESFKQKLPIGRKKVLCSLCFFQNQTTQNKTRLFQLLCAISQEHVLQPRLFSLWWIILGAWFVNPGRGSPVAAPAVTDDLLWELSGHASPPCFFSFFPPPL